MSDSARVRARGDALEEAAKRLFDLHKPAFADRALFIETFVRTVGRIVDDLARERDDYQQRYERVSGELAEMRERVAGLVEQYAKVVERHIHGPNHCAYCDLAPEIAAEIRANNLNISS